VEGKDANVLVALDSDREGFVKLLLDACDAYGKEVQL